MTVAAHGQENAWGLYEQAVDAAERGDLDEALLRYGRAERLATEPDLVRAICYGSGMVARKLVEAQPTRAQSIACRGAVWLDCYLNTKQVSDAEAHRIATKARGDMRAVCQPDDRDHWVWAGAGMGSAAVGAAILAWAFNDAANIRDRKDSFARGGGATASEASVLDADESDARIKYGVGLGLLGAGVGLAAYGTWLYLAPSDTSGITQIKLTPLGFGVHW